MSFVVAVVIGLLAGTHTATWGMFKDSPHEGFTYRRYSRSIFVSTISAPLLAWVAGLNPLTASGIVLLFGATYVTERGVVEFYKTFVRDEDQSKYTIPMQFHVFGKVIRDRWTRSLIAAAHVVVIGAATALLYEQRWLEARLSPVAMILIGGSIGGWISAFGGGFKDAPIEGFHTFKFFRSPVFAAAYALLLSAFTDNLLLMAMGGLGYTVATIETYKTFFFPSKPRGKFADKPITHPENLALRKRFVPIYFGIWLFVIVSFAMAFQAKAEAARQMSSL